MCEDWQNETTLKMVRDKIGVTYEVLKYLGGGGSAKIYKIRHKDLNQIQILKIMDFTYILNIIEKKQVTNISRELEKIKKRFITEAKIYRVLTHPNIVEISEIGFVKHESRKIDIPYLIMEYVEGKTLKEILKEESSLDLKTIFRISENVLSALDTIHQKGIIHRDIKPSNIMIREKNREVVILDFGLAKDIEHSLGITDTHTSMGTLSYTSPEMLEDSKTALLETEIYSFGIVMYEMIAGELPFKGSYPEVLLGHLNPDKSIPEELFPGNSRFARGLNRIIKKAMAKEVKDRYRSAGDFLNDLKKLDKNLERIKIQRRKRKKKVKSEKNSFKLLRRFLLFKYNYLSTLVLIVIVAAFIIFNPFTTSNKIERQYQELIDSAKGFIEINNFEKAADALDKAKVIKDTQEIRKISDTLTQKRREKMSKDFETLKVFLNGAASEETKIAKCRTFLNRHKDIPQNSETEKMVSETDNFISQLEVVQYQKHIDTAKDYINNKDYPKAIDALNEAGLIKDHPEINKLLAEIQIEIMKGDFELLKNFQQSGAAKKKKLEECRKFLDKHKNTPSNDNTKTMVSKTNVFITQLETEIKADEQYQRHIDSAKEYIKNEDYQKAIGELEKAKKIKDSGEILDLLEKIAVGQTEIMKKDFEGLKNFLKEGATNTARIEKCREFLNKHKNVPPNYETRLIVSETNKFISQLDAEIKTEEQYKRHIDAVNRYIKNRDYKKAKIELKKARQIKNADEVKQLSDTIAQGLENEIKNGGKDYIAIKDRLNLGKYLAFRKKYPNSIHLQDLKIKLKAMDKKLPPEKYWDIPIKMNSKGYYELNFGKEHNGHLMIYIPQKKIWIDKYEVSWAQFREFLKDAKIQVPPIEDDIFIRSGSEFPALVTYENAKKYCQKYGLRLPRVDEWEYAAGKGKYTYPWGNESPNVPDADGNWRANFDTLYGGTEKDGFKGTAPVKSFEKFSSPFDAVNMVGNVWEWTQRMIVKGGGFISSEDALKIKQNQKGSMRDKVGLRCVRDEK
jgi:serine/threonine protein kinase